MFVVITSPGKSNKTTVKAMGNLFSFPRFKGKFNGTIYWCCTCTCCLTLAYFNTLYHVYNELEALNVHNISYHTSESGIRKYIALLRPISNEAEGRVG